MNFETMDKTQIQLTCIKLAMEKDALKSGTKTLLYLLANRDLLPLYADEIDIALAENDDMAKAALLSAVADAIASGDRQPETEQEIEAAEKLLNGLSKVLADNGYICSYKQATDMMLIEHNQATLAVSGANFYNDIEKLCDEVDPQRKYRYWYEKLANEGVNPPNLSDEESLLYELWLQVKWYFDNEEYYDAVEDNDDEFYS